MRPAVTGVLTVDETEVVLAVVVGVGEGELDPILANVNDRVERRLLSQLLLEEIPQAILATKLLAVVQQGEATVEEGVVAQAVLDELLVPLEITEDLRIRRELDEGAVLLGGLPAALFVHLLAAAEQGAPIAALAPAADLEVHREGVDRFGADTVQTHRELKDVVVVLAAGMHLRNTVDDLAERDTAAVVANRHRRPIAVDLDAAALAHDELVDGVVDDLLEQNVDAVVGMRAVADTADVHAGAQPDV